MVERALVTPKDDAQLMDFHRLVCFFANDVNRQGRTILYTVMGEDWPTFQELCIKANITLQRMNPENKKKEEWLLVHQGVAEPWAPKFSASLSA